MGRSSKTRLVNLDFTDASLFPQMDIHAFMDCNTFSEWTISVVVETEYIPLRDSTLMSLRDLLVFGTTREANRCTKFLIIQVHNNTLWLY
jgi:hypothetical protein